MRGIFIRKRGVSKFFRNGKKIGNVAEETFHPRFVRVYKPAPFVYRISKLFFPGMIKTLKGFQTSVFLNVEMFFLGKY